MMAKRPNGIALAFGVKVTTEHILCIRRGPDPLSEEETSPLRRWSVLSVGLSKFSAHATPRSAIATVAQPLY